MQLAKMTSQLKALSYMYEILSSFVFFVRFISGWYKYCFLNVSAKWKYYLMNFLLSCGAVHYLLYKVITKFDHLARLLKEILGKAYLNFCLAYILIFVHYLLLLCFTWCNISYMCLFCRSPVKLNCVSWSCEAPIGNIADNSIGCYDNLLVMFDRFANC